MRRDLLALSFVLLLSISVPLTACLGPASTVQKEASEQALAPIEDAAPQEDVIAISPELGAYFTENLGQLGEGAWRFYAMGQGLSVAFGQGRYAYRLTDSSSGRSCLVTVNLVGAEGARPTGVGAMAHPTNFLIGNDPSRWVQGARSYREVVYEDAWGGIDLRFRMTDGELKYEMMVPPGEDPGRIQLRYEGVERLEVDPATGALLITTPVGTITDARPFSFQDVGGKRAEVETTFRLGEGGAQSFDIAPYNVSESLVLDPGLEFSTFIGGSGYEQYPDMVVDSSGNAYITGTTSSTDFPTTAGCIDDKYNGTTDAFVVKVNPTGTALVYSTFLGGSGREAGYAICVDDAGQAYVAGVTASSDFPTTNGAYDRSLNGDGDVFVAKLNSTGQGLVYSTLVGGSVEDLANGIAIDAFGQAYVGGITSSSDFPAVTGSYDTGHNGNQDAFVFKLNATGGGLNYSTFLGGSSYDSANGLAVDSSGRAIAVGQTSGSGFPSTTGAYDATHNGDLDIFVARLDADGKDLSYSTFVGESNYEDSFDVVIGPDDRAYVAGVAYGGFPTTTGAYDTGANGNPDAVVFCLESDGKSMVFSTYLGGSNTEFAYGLVLDASDNIYVTGWTDSGNFPTTSNAYDTSHNGMNDAYLCKFSHDGASLLYSSYFGATDEDWGFTVSLDPHDVAHVIVESKSSGFPTTSGVFDTSQNGNDDLVLMKLVVPSPPYIDDQSPNVATTGDPYTFKVAITGPNDVTGAWVEFHERVGSNPVRINLTRTSGSATDGIWSESIDMPSNSTRPFQYRVFAEDAIGARNRTEIRTISIVDDDAPEVTDLTTGSPTTGDPFTIRMNATDNLGVVDVRLVYWFGASPLANESMVGVDVDVYGNGTYLFNVSVPLGSTAKLHYRFAVNDTSNNWNITGQVDEAVVDDDDPTIVSNLSDTVATTGDPFTFRVDLADNIGIIQPNVEVAYRIYGWSTRTIDMIPSSVDAGGNGTYECTIDVPADARRDINYTIMVFDTSGNFNNTAWRSVAIVDNDAPSYVADRSDTSGTTGDPFKFKVDVADNIGISTVRVEYRIDGGSATSLDLSPSAVDAGGNGTYEVVAVIPSNATLSIDYILTVLDTSGNANVTIEKRVEVMDDDDPSFVADLSDEYGTTGDPFTFLVEATDNVGIADVFVLYWFEGELVPHNRTMTMTASLDVYGFAGLTVPSDSTSALNYRFVMVDATGNWAVTDMFTATVRDDDRPTFGVDGTATSCVKGLALEFSVPVMDNIAVAEVRVMYWYGAGQPTNSSLTGTGPYTLTVTLPRHPAGDLHYLFIASDQAGNWNATVEQVVEPVNLPPMISYEGPWNVLEGVPIELNLTTYITDGNDPLADLTLDWDSGDIHQASPLVIVAQFPEWVVDHSVEFSLTDGEDTTYFNITIHVINVNDEPLITSAPSRLATVGKLYTYRVEFTDKDAGDVHTFQLIQAPQGMTVSAEGVVTWTPARSQHDWHWIVLTLSDGNTTVEQRWPIFVRVSAAEPDNRPPVPSADPPHGAVYGKHFSWRWNVTDDEGDVLRYHLVDVPEGATIDNATGLLEWDVPITAEEFTTFRLNVTDGVNVVPLNFTVRVRHKANQSPQIQGTIPDLKLKKEHTIDLAGYRSDPDDPVTNLTWSLKGGNDALFNVTLDGGKLVIRPVKGAKGTASVTLMLSDPSGDMDYQAFDVSVKPSEATMAFPWWALLLVILVAVAAAVMMRRRRDGSEETVPEPTPPTPEAAQEDVEVELDELLEEVAAASTPIPAPVVPTAGRAAYIVEQVYVVYRDGRLVVECTREECRTRDADLMSGMLIAIQGLIQDGLESGGALKSINYGDNIIRMVQGEHVVLAAVVYGEPDDALGEELEEVVRTVEGAYAGVIEEWSGDLEQLGGIRQHVDPLIQRTAHLERGDVGAAGAAGGVSMLSAVDFYRGYVRLKAAAVNSTEELVAKASMEVTYDTDLLRLERVEPETLEVRGDRVALGMIMPGERRTVAFLFDPQICQETYLDGHLQYYDTRGKVHQVQMKRRQATVVCPVFFTRENANTAMLKRLVKEKLHHTDFRVFRYPGEIGPKEALAVGTSALGGDIQQVSRYEVEGPPYEGEVWFYAETKVKGYQMVMRMSVIEQKGVLEFFCASTAMEPITGLLAEFKRELNRVLHQRNASDAEVEADEELRRELERRKLLIDRVGEGEIEPGET